MLTSHGFHQGTIKLQGRDYNEVEGCYGNYLLCAIWRYYQPCTYTKMYSFFYFLEQMECLFVKDFVALIL